MIYIAKIIDIDSYKFRCAYYASEMNESGVNLRAPVNYILWTCFCRVNAKFGRFIGEIICKQLQFPYTALY